MSLVPPQRYLKIENLHRSGLASARPAAADVVSGTLYFSTDTGILERSDGTIWSSYSDIADSVRLYNSGNFSIPFATWTALTWDTEVYDIGGLHSTVSNTARITAILAGRYVIVGGANFDVSSTGARFIRIFKNATTELAVFNTAAFPTYSLRLNVTTLAVLAVNDYVTLEVYQDGAAPLNLFGGDGPTFFAAHRLSS